MPTCDCCQREVQRVRHSMWHNVDAICQECFFEWYDPSDPTVTEDTVASKTRISDYVRSKHGLPALSTESH